MGTLGFITLRLHLRWSNFSENHGLYRLRANPSMSLRPYQCFLVRGGKIGFRAASMIYKRTKRPMLAE